MAIWKISLTGGGFIMATPQIAATSEAINWRSDSLIHLADLKASSLSAKRAEKKELWLVA